MLSHDADWAPPVDFYFQVWFQWKILHAEASFMEVSGMSLELTTEEVELKGDDGCNMRLPTGVRHGDLVLRRPLEPLSDVITNWVKRCLSFTVDGRISLCTLIIALTDARRIPVACWSCSEAYPVKWDLGALNSQKSGLAVETLTMTYNRLERVM